MFFSLALRENKSTTAHAQTFFQSINMRFSLAPCGQVVEISTIVHTLTFCSLPHKLF